VFTVVNALGAVFDREGNVVRATSTRRPTQPFHTLVDGDVLYAVTTNEVEDPRFEDIGLGVVASEPAWDAVLSAVQQ
jgi:6-aminohexanoate-oligomer endohydrolase